MSQQDKIALLSQIPNELKLLNQWVVWKYENVNNADKPTKPPYNAKTGSKASVTDPSSWCSFADAVNCLANGGNYSGVGFVFSDRDDYSIIDLDKAEGSILQKQQQIAQEFDSYSEVSPSGYGLHIIVKGKVPTGKRKDCIEVYSNLRYATFTGNVFKNKPIVDCQDKLTKLWEELNETGKDFSTNQVENSQSNRIDEVEKFSDAEILEICRSASNGEKFQKLYSGEWKGDYPSQSEADLALVNIIAYYTKNRNQIVRMFRQSKLGQRKKAARNDYVNWMVDKSFDQTLPPIDFDLYNKEIEEKLSYLQEQRSPAKPASDNSEIVSNATGARNVSDAGTNRPVAQRLEPSAHNGLVASSNLAGPTNSIVPPPGLLGELAQFIYQAAPRPVPEIALAAAIGLMAGICGRAYNISGTGLNQYILVLAKTGSGKEGAASGIDKLLNSVKMLTPTAINFRGPGIINSGQALAKYIGTQSHCFLSVLGEFGIRLENMSAQNALASEKALKALLLDLYNKSGKGQTIQANIYSSKDDTVGVFESPAFSLLGESTPDRFYSILNESMIAEGLLPRFTIIEYKGKRPPFNEHHQNIYPNGKIIDNLSDIIANVEAITFEKPRKVIDVQQSDEALKLTREFDKYADEKINNTDSDVIAELWNRAHMKVLKLSALIAIGCCYTDPVIIPDYVNWAINLVVSDINALSAKFVAGEIGEKPSDENKQLNDMVKTIKEYLTSSWKDVMPYCNSNRKEMHKEKIMPYEYLNRRTGKLSSFKNNKPTESIKRCLQVLIDCGKLVERTKDINIINKFGGIGGRVFEIKSAMFD